MAKGLVWATAEDLASNRAAVLSLYRQILRCLNSPKLPLNLAARLAKKGEARTIFLLASEERSLHNIADLMDAAEYTISLFRKERKTSKSQPKMKMVEGILNATRMGSNRSSLPVLFKHRFSVGTYLCSPWWWWWWRNPDGKEASKGPTQDRALLSLTIQRLPIVVVKKY